MVEDPVLGLESRGIIGIQRLVAVEQDAALVVQVLDGRESDTRELGQERQFQRWPSLGPIGTDEDNGTLWDPAVLLFIIMDVNNLHLVTKVLLDLGGDVNDNQRTNGNGSRQFVDGGGKRVPVSRGVKLSTELISLEVVGSGFKAILGVGIDFSSLGINGTGKVGIAKTSPDRDIGSDGVGQVNVLGTFQMIIVQ